MKSDINLEKVVQVLTDLGPAQTATIKRSGDLYSVELESNLQSEVMEQIKAPSLMKEYLGLFVEERWELAEFLDRNKEYLSGSESKGRDVSLSQGPRELIQKIRLTNLLLDLFAFYLEHRQDGEVFNTNYILNNKRLKNKFGALGKKIYNGSHGKVAGGIEKIFEVAEEIDPRVKQYRGYKHTILVDGPRQLLNIFDFFLKNRQEGDIFNQAYLERPELKGLGTKISSGAKTYLAGEGGMDKIFEVAEEIDPRVKLYRSYKQTLLIDGPIQLLKLFDFYLEHRNEGEVFNANYIRKNKTLRQEFGTLGWNLYKNIGRNLSKGGGMNLIVQLAAQQRPEILGYWSFYRQKAA